MGKKNWKNKCQSIVFNPFVIMTTATGENFLHAVRRGDITTMKSLLILSRDTKALCNYKTADGACPLNSVNYGNNQEQVFNLLITYGGNPNETWRFSGRSTRQTLLHLHCQGSGSLVSYETAALLLAYGADLTLVNENGMTAYELACSNAEKESLHRTVKLFQRVIQDRQDHQNLPESVRIEKELQLKADREQRLRETQSRECREKTFDEWAKVLGNDNYVIVGRKKIYYERQWSAHDETMTLRLIRHSEY